MSYSVYMHICKINNKKYIGITCQNPYKRFGKNGNGYKTSIKFFNAINKYGWDNFEHVILYENLSKEEANNKEKELIEFYDTMNDENGYNIKPGGNDEEMPQSIKEKISIANKGKDCWNKGGHWSEETKNKIREAQKGRSMSESHYNNFIKAMNKRKGKPGRKLSQEEKELLKIRSEKKVYCVELDKTYDSYTKAAEELHLHVANISKVIDKPNRTTGSYHFQSVNLECVTTIENVA